MSVAPSAHEVKDVVLKSFFSTYFCYGGYKRFGEGGRIMVLYKKVNIEGLNIFFREAGSPNHPAIILLH